MYGTDNCVPYKIFHKGRKRIDEDLNILEILNNDRFFKTNNLKNLTKE